MGYEEGDDDIREEGDSGDAVTAEDDAMTTRSVRLKALYVDRQVNLPVCLAEHGGRKNEIAADQI